MPVLSKQSTMSNDNKYIRLVKNSGIIFVGTVGSRLLNFILIPFYTKYLCPEEYGSVDLTITYSTILSGLCTCQIHDAVFIFPKQADLEKQKKYFSSGLIFLMFTMGGATLFFLFLKLCCNLDAFFTEYGVFILFYLYFNSAQSYLQQFCRSIDKIGVYAFAGFGVTLATLLAAFLLLPCKPIGKTLIFVQYIGFGVGILITVVFGKLWNYLTVGYEFKKDLMPMLQYSIPLIPTSLMWWMTSSLNRPLLKTYISLSAVGIYAIALKFSSIINSLWNGVLGNALQISVVDEYHKDGFGRFFNNVFSFILFASLGIQLCFTAGAPLIRYLIASDYYSGIDLIPLLTLSAIFVIFSSSIGTIFTAIRQSRYFLYSSIVTLVVILSANFILIPTYGLFGAAIATVIGGLSELLLRVYFVRTFIVLSDFRRYITVAIGFGLLLISYYLITSRLLSFLLYGIVFYFITIYFYRQWNKNNFIALLRRKRC